MLNKDNISRITFNPLIFTPLTLSPGMVGSSGYGDVDAWEKGLAEQEKIIKEDPRYLQWVEEAKAYEEKRKAEQQQHDKEVLEAKSELLRKYMVGRIKK